MSWETIPPLSRKAYTIIKQTLPDVVNRKSVSEWKKKHSEYSDWTLQSIAGLECQKQMSRKYKCTPQLKQHLYTQYRELELTQSKPGIIIELSEKVRFTPALVSNIIVEAYKDENGLKDRTSVLMKNLDLIEDTRLAREVMLATYDDCSYGAFTEAVKHQVGIDFEDYLKKLVEERGIPYKNEIEMRLEGYPKTPDLKLDIPIYVDGCVVNWIESKALFGEDENHAGYLKSQYRSYWNRFGPGMVIYWFGFIEDLDCDRDEGVMLTTDFPANFETLPRFEADVVTNS